MPEAVVLNVTVLLGQAAIETNGVIDKFVLTTKEAVLVTVLQAPLTSTE